MTQPHLKFSYNSYVSYLATLVTMGTGVGVGDNRAQKRAAEAVVAGVGESCEESG
jgi:hypothetical protein